MAEMQRLAPVAFLVLWSAGFSFVALGLPDSEPFTFLALRYAIVVGLLVVALAVLRPPLPATRRDWIDLATVGLLLQAGYFALLYVALDLESSTGTIALIVSLQPILVALATSAEVTARRWLGLGIGLIGAAVVIASRSSVGSLSAGGLLCAVGSLLALTSSTLYENRFGSEHHHPVTANAVQCGVALALTLPPALLIEGFPVAWTSDLAISLTYLVLANSLVSITLLLMMMRRGEASRVSALFFLVPPLAAAIAWAVLGEDLPGLAWVGMVLAAVGVWIATSASSPRSRRPPAPGTPARRG
jgi:drug/metabolite transporter (DMT)-like permease